MIQHTTMAIAFADCKYNITSMRNGLVSKVGKSLDHYAKNRRPIKDWSARLSFKTARYLASKGVPLQ